MKLALFLSLLSRFHPGRRMLGRIALLAFLACAAGLDSSAAKPHVRHIFGTYLTGNGRLLQALAQRKQGIYWIDGYQMALSQQTKICWHLAPLDFGPVLNRDGQPVTRLTVSSPCNIAAPDSVWTTTWLEYSGIEKFVDFFRPDMNVVAARVDVWESNRIGNRGLAEDAAQAQTWQTLCVSPLPHQLRYPDENPIDVVCDPKVNRYIADKFASLLRPSALAPDAQRTKPEMPRFFVVKPFKVRHNYDFETIDGSLADVVAAVYADTFYERPHARSTVREIVYTPDGTALIPDTALARLHNAAECAALLSYSLATARQEIIEHLFRVQRFQCKAWSLCLSTGRGDNESYTGLFLTSLNRQVLRLGIRQMYLAGYNIREAPFAWAIARGKKIANPLIDANDNGFSLWYAAYAFNYISQDYKNVDFSKPKRGEAEYAQFLDELRKADPEAFERKK